MPSHAEMSDLLRTREKNHSLPQPFYNDPAFHGADLEGIFQRRWLLAGFECEIARPGDYLTFAVGRSSILVLRDEAGEVRAFFNTCRHRGSKICLTETGNARKLTCPYHQWTYALDGKLLFAAKMHEGFDPGTISLKALPLEVLEGMIYICLADEAPSFGPYRNALEPYLKPYDLGNTKLAHTQVLVEKANWKLVVENSRECYHCHARHPEFVKHFFLDYPYPSIESDPNIVALWEKCRAAGLPSGPEHGEDFEINRLRFEEGALSITMDGKPAVAKRLGIAPDWHIGTLRWEHFPSMFGHVFADYAFFFRLLPIGPEETLVTAKWFVHRDAVEGRDYNLENLIKVWAVTNEQDRDLVERNQEGINSIGYRPGPYSQRSERSVIKFSEWYCATMLRHLDGPLRAISARA
jgi:phenylpropionate dioxygenase-like ring-hydroxylating dioxygenase large terminal subunit